jgi:hypothetical protein
LEDFLKRCDKVINKKSLEWLIKSWALDKFQNRNTLLNNIDMLLWRSKSSQNMSMWLFWGDDSTTKIVFNKIYDTSFEEKLMYDQEVFKCFVSWHLLDWLYKYLKKNTFLSRLNIEKNVWPFEITWYISNIQRAKKKWFFIEVEDISGKREFFLKEILDLKKFNLVKISWFKNEWRYPRLSKLIKTKRDILIKNAWWSYDPSMTVTVAKWLRLWELKTELLEAEDKKFTWPSTTITNDDNTDDENIIQESDTVQETNENNMNNENNYEWEEYTNERTYDQNNDNEYDEENIDDITDKDTEWQGEIIENQIENQIENTETKKESDNEIFDFDIPNNITEIQKLKEILTQDTWNISIRIWWIEKHISENWLQKIRNLLKK